MQTILRGKSKEVVIDTSEPVIIIGESLNPTRRKKPITTLSENDFEFVLETAESQIKEGNRNKIMSNFRFYLCHQ